jgi:hypothetical protein
MPTKLEKASAVRPARLSDVRFKGPHKGEVGVNYEIRVTGWRPYYSFGEDPMRGPTRFSETANLVVFGEAVTGRKTQKASIKLAIFDIDLTVGRRKEGTNGVGHLDHVKGGLEGLVMLPKTSADFVLGLLRSEKIEFLLLFGTKVHPRHSDIDSFVLKTSIDDFA